MDAAAAAQAPAPTLAAVDLTAAHLERAEDRSSRARTSGAHPQPVELAAVAVELAHSRRSLQPMELAAVAERTSRRGSSPAVGAPSAERGDAAEEEEEERRGSNRAGAAAACCRARMGEGGRGWERKENNESVPITDGRRENTGKIPISQLGKAGARLL